MPVKYWIENQVVEDRFPRSGDRVFWFSEGDHKNVPCPALVNVDSNEMRSLSLTVFTVNGPMLKDGVKHVSAGASVIDRNQNGGWAWNRFEKEYRPEE